MYTMASFKLCFLLLYLVSMVTGQNQAHESDQKHYLENAASQVQQIGQLSDDPFTNNDTQALLDSIRNTMIQTHFMDVVRENAEAALAEGLEAFRNGTAGISPICLNHTEMILQGISSGEMWALSVIDAMGKPPSNMLGYNFRWLGSYEECVAIKAPFSAHYPDQPSPFKGRYCTAEIKVSGPTATFVLGVTLSVGICVPNSCNSQDATNLLKAGLLALPVTKDLPEASVKCQKDELEFDTKAIAAMLICGMFALLMVFGTLYDVLFVQLKLEEALEEKSQAYSLDVSDLKQEKRKHGQHILGKVLLAFSMYTNGAKILNTSQPAGALTAVNGIRFLSMSWVILGHTYGFIYGYVENFVPFYAKNFKRFTFQAVGNATVSVDSFFVLSGLLVSYLAMKEMKKVGGPKKFKWGMYYFHRFWRLTPPYMLFMMLYICLYKYWSEGPMWSQTGLGEETCRKYWWRNILYINNLFDDAQCMGWSWYLANDMQFYVLTPLILVALYVSPIIGGLVSSVFFLLCFISAGIITKDKNLPPNLILDSQSDYMNAIYFKPYTRVGPYMVGVLTGYLLYRTDCKLRIPKILNLFFWALATAVALAVLYGLYQIDGDNTLNVFSNSISAAYNALSRTAWGIAVAWVIVACATGNGGFVNTLLSWSPFVPLGRLTYCAYLVHPIVMYVFYGSNLSLIHPYDLSVIYIFLGHLCVAYGVAFCISLAFESPMMGLEKALLGRDKKS